MSSDAVEPNGSETQAVASPEPIEARLAAIYKLCPGCLYASQRAESDWRCHHPLINRMRPSFLAGNTMAATRCITERSNVVGLCGRKGLLFVAKVEKSPKDSA